MDNVENYFLSLNQMIEYSTATEKGKERIIHQQIEPDVLRIPWYQSAKGSMRRALKDKVNLEVINETISKLDQSDPDKKWKKTNKSVSMEALELFKEIEFPSIFKSPSFTSLKGDFNSVIINDVKLIIAPEIIFSYMDGDTEYIGAIKLHISKNKQFDYHKANLAAVIVNQYLIQDKISKGRLVSPTNCFSLDVFGSRLMKAPVNQEIFIREIENICSDIKDRWNRAAA